MLRIIIHQENANKTHNVLPHPRKNGQKMHSNTFWTWSLYNVGGNTTIMKDNTQIPHKSENKITLWPRHPTFRNLTKWNELSLWELSSNSTYNGKIYNQSQCPSTELVQENVVYILWNTALPKYKIMSFETKWLQLEAIILSEINPKKTNGMLCMLYGN